MFRRMQPDQTRAGRGGMRPWVGIAATGGLLLALAPGTAQAQPATAPQPAAATQPQRLLDPPAATRTVSATVHFASGKSYLTAYSQKILVALLRTIPAGASVQSTKVVGYVQARTAWDNGRALGTARAVEVRAHLRALGLAGRIDIASGGIKGSVAKSRQAVVTITYRPQAAQTVWFVQPEGMTVGDTDMPLQAYASSGLRVTVRSATAPVCTVTGTLDAPTLHAVSAGTCSLTATQAGNAVYRAASAVRTLTVDPVHINPPAPTSYDVTYEAGAADPEPATWTEGDDALVLPNAAREGYTFDGWFTAAEGGTEVGAAGDDFTPDADVTLYAHWIAIPTSHVVTFHSNYVGGPDATTQESEDAAALTANPFGDNQNGLTFAGWATEAGGAVVYIDGATYDFAADEDLYAVWGFSVIITAGGWQESTDVWYCARADGHCATDLIHLVIPADQWMTSIVVFPNVDEGGDLGGYEVKLGTIRWGSNNCGLIFAEGTENTWYNGVGPVRFDVQTSGHLHLDMG